MPSIALQRLRSRIFRQEWSIGIRTGPSPMALAERGLEPVLTGASVTDLAAGSVADPFLLRAGGTWYMFFEVVPAAPAPGRGVIGLATSEDGLRWSYQRIVLAEPFHLSYPHVLEWRSDFYMVPESAEAGTVRLYRADPFPTRWRPVAELLRGPGLVDASPFRHGGRWWMLVGDSAGYLQDTLRLFGADALAGPWREHACSPVVRGNARLARPAGRVISLDGRLLRFGQDCRRAYGSAVCALEITRLDGGGYQEVVLPGNPLLAGSGCRWSRDGMHHLDPVPWEGGGWLACVDGWRERLRGPGEVLSLRRRGGPGQRRSEAMAPSTASTTRSTASSVIPEEMGSEIDRR